MKHKEIFLCAISKISNNTICTTSPWEERYNPALNAHEAGQNDIVREKYLTTAGDEPHRDMIPQAGYKIAPLLS